VLSGDAQRDSGAYPDSKAVEKETNIHEYELVFMLTGNDNKRNAHWAGIRNNRRLPQHHSPDNLPLPQILSDYGGAGFNKVLF
jgi:hypothetical protein